MICACQMMATDSKPIRNTQNASATLVCDSAAGRRRVRTNQAIGNLLVPLVLGSFVHAAKLLVSTRHWSNLSSTLRRLSRAAILWRNSAFSRLALNCRVALLKFVQWTLGKRVSFLTSAATNRDNCQPQTSSIG